MAKYSGPERAQKGLETEQNAKHSSFLGETTLANREDMEQPSHGIDSPDYPNVRNLSQTCRSLPGPHLRMSEITALFLCVFHPIDSESQKKKWRNPGIGTGSSESSQSQHLRYLLIHVFSRLGFISQVPSMRYIFVRHHPIDSGSS